MQDARLSANLEEVVSTLFVGNAEAARLFRHVGSYITSLGPVEIILRKTQVTFRRNRGFAWVWLPQLWIKTQPRESITVAFGLDRRVRDSRIKQSVEPYPGRFTHHVVISEIPQFDVQVKAWIREAYDLASRPRRARREPH